MSYERAYREATTIADKILAGSYEPREPSKAPKGIARRSLEDPLKKLREQGGYPGKMVGYLTGIRKQNEMMNPNLTFGLEEPTDGVLRMQDDPALSFDGKEPAPIDRSVAGSGNPFTAMITRTESGGRYDTLFGHSQESKWGIDVSNMSLGEVISFAEKRGPGSYGEWVKGELAASGQKPRIATPMGFYQYVGSTLKERVSKMGLSLDQKFDPKTQDAIFLDHVGEILKKNSKSLASQRNALRDTWEGFRKVSNEELNEAISNWRNA